MEFEQPAWNNEQEKEIKLEKAGRILTNVEELKKFIARLEWDLKEAQQDALRVKGELSKDYSRVGKFGTLFSNKNKEKYNEDMISQYENAVFELHDLLKEAQDKLQEIERGFLN